MYNIRNTKNTEFWHGTFDTSEGSELLVSLPLILLADTFTSPTNFTQNHLLVITITQNYYAWPPSC
jgi:hypothetical protein